MNDQLTAPLTRCPECGHGTVTAGPLNMDHTSNHPGYELLCGTCGWNGYITKDRFDQLIYEGTMLYEFDQLTTALHNLFTIAWKATIGRIRQ